VFRLVLGKILSVGLTEAVENICKI
jgi:hypothetical protein